MSDLIFRISQNIVLGSYTISRLPQNVKVWGSRFMIVMDPVLKEVGLQDKVLQPLLERKIEYFIYENITDGANTKEIEQALVLAQQGRVHGIIAAGGSKALHLGAAVAALYNENHSVYDYMDGAVPTTDRFRLYAFLRQCARRTFLRRLFLWLIRAAARQNY